MRLHRLELAVAQPYTRPRLDLPKDGIVLIRLERERGTSERTRAAGTPPCMLWSTSDARS